MITKPMLAQAVENIDQIKFPVWGTPKLDGIRCLKINGKVLSRKFKDIPNHYVRNLMLTLPDGLDGELIVPGQTFNEIQSSIMSEEGTPDFRYVVFDYVGDSLKESYEERTSKLLKLELPAFCTKLTPDLISNIEELKKFEDACLAADYEGVMLRSGEGPYKCGRSTVREGYLLKFKRFNDSEAEVVGFEERLHNNNELEKDELGYAKRSHKKANLVPANTLGTLLVRDIHTGVEFGIGTGFDDETRKKIWDHKTSYLGKIVNYQYQPAGVKDKPRFPSFRGFRHGDDL